MPGPETTTVTLGSSLSRIAAIHDSVYHEVSHDPSRISVEGTFKYAALLAAATAAIDAKAAQLGGLPGAPVSDVEGVAYGFVRRYQGCDIYDSETTGAHEVHGDIRAKYNALGGPNGALGLPTTDETGTPDGVGRYNHFSGGSIYWTPTTGPMMVRGAVRDLWASGGWERGPLGYPVIDQYRLHSFSPATDPALVWNVFQNGAIVSTPDGTAVAFAAEVGPEQLRRLIRQKFDEAFHASPNDIGLQPQVETIAVSDWGYGFWASRPRLVTFRLHGFHDNGLAPDTDFELDARLRFGLSWSDQTFTEPGTKTLVVELDWVSVTAHGLFSGSVADGVANGVRDAFKEPRSIIDIPTGATVRPPITIDVIGLLVTRDGGLEVLLNPLPEVAGTFRRLIAQQRIDAFLE